MFEVAFFAKYLDHECIDLEGVLSSQYYQFIV